MNQLASSLDKQIAAKNSNRKLPDAAFRMEAKRREFRKPPIDILTVGQNGDEYLQNLTKGFGERLHTTWARVAEAAADRNVPLPKLAKAADVRRTEIVKEGSRIEQNCRDYAESLQKQIDGFMKPVAPHLATEIRTFVRGLSQGERMEAIKNDPRIASAVFDGPSALSGMRDDELKSARNIAERSFAPGFVDQRDKAEAAANAVGQKVTDFSLAVDGGIQRWALENDTLGALKEV